jgi:hypothetical protein
MTALPMILIALHVLPAVFWAGSTFVVAHGAVTRMERLARSQLGAAVVAILAGGALWGFTRPYGTAKTIIEIGAACAIAALVLQIISLPAARQLGGAGETDADALRRWVLITQRFAAGLLAVCVICMVIWRFA